MKRTAIALFMALILILGLGGCTRNKTHSGTADNGSGADTGHSSGITDGTQRSTDDPLRGRSYEEMLQDGRISDTDGYLSQDRSERNR